MLYLFKAQEYQLNIGSLMSLRVIQHQLLSAHSNTEALSPCILSISPLGDLASPCYLRGKVGLREAQGYTAGR